MHKYALAACTVALFLLPLAAFADASLSTTPPYPGTTVNAGTRVSFSVLPSGFNGPVTYRIVDSFGGGANNGNIDASGNFFWNTNISLVGTHVITITATDAQGTTTNTTQTITVQSGPTANLQAATSTVVVGTQVSFTVTTQGLFNPTYSVADSFTNSSLRNSTVNADGTFVWTPLWQDIGTHTISVTSKDSFGYSTTAPQTITVISNLPTATSTSSTSTPAVAPITPQSNASTTVQTPAKLNAYTFTKFLAIGSTGADVTALQQLLIAGKYLNGSATGYFGQATKRAVMTYQSAHGLQPLGYVGPGTRAALTKGL